MSVNKKVAKQCLSLSSLLAPLKLRSLHPCAITRVQAIAWTATLAYQPLVNYRRKDCQLDAGVSPNCAVTFHLGKRKTINDLSTTRKLSRWWHVTRISKVVQIDTEMHFWNVSLTCPCIRPTHDLDMLCKFWQNTNMYGWSWFNDVLTQTWPS